MEIILYLLCGIIGAAVLYYGAEWLVKGSSALAEKAGVSPLVTGLTIVACATSAPELVVSVCAAIDGSPGLSLGNIIGSNICNIALILGLCACVTPLEVKKSIVKSDAPVMAGASILLAVFYFSSNGLARWQGIVFLLLFGAYLFRLISAAKKEHSFQGSQEKSKNKNVSAINALLLTFSGLAALTVGAKMILWSSVFFARQMQISETVIGLTAVAVGTSLPELAASFVAAVRGEKDIAVGNVIGSNIFNILGILGITPVITPLQNTNISTADISVMLFCSILVLPVMRSNWKISRKEGMLLLAIYISYTAYLIWKA